MRKKIYIAAYHQSKFGKLLALTVTDIMNKAVLETLAQVGATTAQVDVAAVGAACNISLNAQGLVSGLVAMVPGMGGKSIESLENACASGGQAILSVAMKLMVGDGEVGLALGYEKMRDAEGKMDGKLIGQVLGHYSHPDDRVGKTYIFPHLFAEVMDTYIKHWGVTERDLATIAVQEYANGNQNPYAQMQKVTVSLEEAAVAGDRNRYLIEGLPMKTYDCSQITDGYAGLLLATEEGLARLGLKKADCVELAGFGQATDPLLKAGRDVLHPVGANRAMRRA